MTDDRAGADEIGAQRVLTRAATVLSASLDPRETLHRLTRTVVPALADWCAVHLLEPDGRLALAEVAHADPARVAQAWEVERMWPADGAARGLRAIVGTGMPLRIERIDAERLEDAAAGPDHLAALRDLGLRSLVAVPLRARGRVVGALTLVAAESGRTYTESDLEIASELAGMAALALDNARLLAEADLARREAERAAGITALLADATTALAEVLDPDLALARLADLAVTLMADYAVTYAVRGDELQRIGLAHADPAQRHAVEDLVQAGPPRLSDAYGAGAVLRTGEPILAPRIDPELLARAAQNPRHLAALRRLQPRSSLVVPLRARGRAIGALALAATDRSGRVYTQDDLHLAEKLSARTAVLVDNARLYREALEAVRARDEAVAMLAHDLRSPLAAVVSAVEVLQIAGPEADARMVGVIRRSTRHMERLVDDLLDVARIEAGKMVTEVAPTDVSELCADAAELVSALALQRGVAVDVVCSAGGGSAPTPAGCLPAVLLDRSRLLQALTNLLANAVKFSPPGGRVTVSATVGEVELRIGVRDQGPGISAEDQKHLFERFWQGRPLKGAGLGLTIVRGIVEAHGGSVEVRSEVGGGAEFTLIVPVRSA